MAGLSRDLLPWPIRRSISPISPAIPAATKASLVLRLGGPLDEGEREGDTVVCPWHGSRFDLCTGEVRGGPAVYPQPRYEARVRAEKVEIRAAQD